jgi:acetyl-CoA synthetase
VKLLRFLFVYIQASPHLPKTRSGKIMRRILRKIATNKHDEKNLGDISTLADPSVVADLIERHQRHKKKHFKV